MIYILLAPEELVDDRINFKKKPGGPKSSTGAYILVCKEPRSLERNDANS
ncbi:hypothetical protein [Candidatus Tisiphia endosymbiont of Beris chalybata]